ncbi:7614_t:CDS:2, partial [Acaulospora colombiana]
MIKEEALARGNQPSSLPTSPGTVVPDQATPRVETEQNPLAQDMIENRASWTSFFSLRAAHGAKKVTLQGEPPEEEVMEIDVNTEIPVTQVPAPTVSLSNAPSIVGKKVAGIIASSTSTPSSKPRSSSAGPARRGPPKPPLTDSESIRRKVTGLSTTKRSSSATPSKRSLPPQSASKAPNMILPTFGDTFYTLPRALPPHTRPTTLKKVGRLVSGVLGITSNGGGQVSNDEMREWQAHSGAKVPRNYEGLRSARDVGRDLPRVGEVLGIQDVGRIKECKRIVIIGVHGTLLGEPTGTSPKFASMMEAAVKRFMEKQDVVLEKITCMPLEGEGTIEKRVEKVEDLQEADVVFVATHSQGSVVSTQLLDRLIADGHIRTSKGWELVKATLDTAVDGIGITVPP